MNIFLILSIAAVVLIYSTFNFSEDFYLCEAKDKESVTITQHDFKMHGCEIAGGNQQWPLRSKCDDALRMVLRSGFKCKYYEMRL